MVQIGLSLGVSPREEVRRFVSLAQQAERQGVDQLWLIDSQFAMKDAYAAMSIALWETERLSVGTGVTNLQTRHISVLANSLATLGDLAPGRVILGLGAGDSAVFPLGQQPSKIADLRRGIRALRALLRGDEVSWEERKIEMPFTADPPPPVYLSASQPRMLELAGAEADGVIVMGAADRDLIAQQIGHVLTGVKSAGRAPSDVAIDVWATVSVDENAEKAVGDVKSWASAKARWMSQWRQLPPSLERFRPEMEASARAYDFGDHLSVKARHASEVSDELARALAIAGDVDQCAQRLSEIVELNPDRLTVTLLSGGREHRLETLMAGLLPAIRARQSIR